MPLLIHGANLQKRSKFRAASFFLNFESILFIIILIDYTFEIRFCYHFLQHKVILRCCYYYTYQMLLSGMIIYCIYQHQKIASKSATFSVLIEHQMIFKNKYLCELPFLDFADSQSYYMFVLEFHILSYSYSYFFFMCLLLIFISIYFTFHFWFRKPFLLIFSKKLYF